MNSTTKRQYVIDSLIVVVAMVTFWLTLLFVGSAVYGLLPDHFVQVLAIVIWLAVGIFATSALFAVLIHLRKNRDTVYIDGDQCR